jgi:hypothetical protein
VGPNTDSKEEEGPKLLERGAVGRVQVQDISKITTPQQIFEALKIRFFFFFFIKNFTGQEAKTQEKRVVEPSAPCQHEQYHETIAQRQ